MSILVLKREVTDERREVSLEHPLPVTDETLIPDIWRDKSSTITTGGTAQNAVGANQSRTYLLVNNPSATEDLWFNVGVVAVAAQPSVRLPPGAAWENPPHFRPTGFVSVIAATSAHAFTVKEA